MFDMHVHAEPEVVPRRWSDAELIEVYKRAGFVGCVLKGHFDSTVGRAKILTEPGFAVYGGLALNAQVAGFNPSAVDGATAMGARVIWMPTLDARSGLHRISDFAFGPPRLAHAASYAAPPAKRSSADAITSILEIIAGRDAVLATGHLGPRETKWVVERALDVGVQRIVLTHPSFTVPNISASAIAELSHLGAFVEVTAFQLYCQPEMTVGRLAQSVRQIGVERVILSSDMGQVDLPDPPEALGHAIEALSREGIDESSLLRCASSIPRSLVAP
jgi:hypothetical protein